MGLDGGAGLWCVISAENANLLDAGQGRFGPRPPGFLQAYSRSGLVPYSGSKPVPESKIPNLIDIDTEDDSTVLVQATSIRGSSPAESRDRHLLVRIEGESLGQVTTLRDQEIVIGRAQTAALCVVDPGVSRHHAVLVRGPRSYMIRDMGSANGTYVSGEQVDE